jgi:hypothetical protein
MGLWAMRPDGRTMKSKRLAHHWSFSELAEMLGVPEDHLRHLFGRNHLRPSCWTWRSKWPEPRFPESAIPEWGRLLDQFPPSSFDGPPPELERPAQTFRESRQQGATPGEIEAFLRLFPERERERLRSMK